MRVWIPGQPQGNQEVVVLPLEIFDELLDDRVRVTLAGEVDTLTAVVLRSALDRAVASRLDIELHMAEVQFIDSVGLGVVVAAWNAMPAGRSLTIVEASAPVARVFGITSLSMMFGMPAEVAADAVHT